MLKAPMPKSIRKSILWITPKWPLPAHDGARIATTQLIKNVTRMGVSVDLLSIVESNQIYSLQAQQELGVRRVFLIQRKETASTTRKLLQLAEDLLFDPSRPLTLEPYSEPKVKEAFQAIWKDSASEWDSVLFDGMHAAAICSDGKRFAPPKGCGQIIYRAHNVEAELWSQASARTRIWPKKWALGKQADNVRNFEKSLLQQSDSVAAVSNEDLVKLQALVPGMHGTSIPIGIDIPNPGFSRSFSGIRGKAPKPSGNLNLLFLGRLDWPPNRDGLKWFLKQVWPEVSEKRPNLSLVIAGKGDGEWLKEYERLPNLVFMGSVKSTAPLYENCVLSLVPIFFGSGTRVKVIESSLYGRACISTALGVEGTGLVPQKTYIRAETREEWIQALAHLDASEAGTMGTRAFSTLSKVFCPEASAKKLLSLVENFAV